MDLEGIDIWIESRLEKALPGEVGLGDPAEHRRARALLMLCWMLMPTGLMFAVLFHGILGAHTVGLATDMMIACVVVAWALVGTQGAHRMGALVLAAGAWFVMAWGMAVTGGFESPWTPFLIVVPVIASTVLPGRHAVVIGVFHTITALLFFALSLSGVVLKSSMTPFAASMFTAVGIPVAIVLVLATIRASRRDLGVTVDEHREMLARTAKAEATADAARRVRQVFLTIMSHELRTPLNSVFASLEMMELRGHLDPETPKYMRRMEMACHTLLGVINDTIDWSRLESGALKLEYAEADPLDLARRVVETLRDRADQRGLQLRMDVAAGVPRLMLTDPRRVLQVLLALVGNSLTFTAVGSVTLCVSNYGSEIRFEVVDTGPGVPEGTLAAMFDPWERTNPSNHRRPRGSGLGLAISGRFIRALGGRIHAESQIGHGTTIYVDLPVESATLDIGAEAMTFEGPRPIT
ncbi:MAG: signal transduction histidine kinase [Kiritimatiellia bacterium]|jgi:signal transduction histidine kinase